MEGFPIIASIDREKALIQSIIYYKESKLKNKRKLVHL